MSETLFGEAVPAGSFVQSDGITVGTRIRCTVNGQITALRWYVPSPGPTGDNIQWFLVRYNPADDTPGPGVASGTIPLSSLPPEGSWATIPLDAPVDVAAGDEFIAEIWSPNRYPATSNFFTTDVISPGGHLVGPADAPGSTPPRRNGRFREGAPGFPTSGFNGTAYFVDVEFVPTGPIVAQAGFEWGTTAGLATGNAGNRILDASAGTFSIDPAAARSGNYGLRVGLSNSWVAWTTATIGAGRTAVVGSLYFRFPTLLPGADVVFLSLDTAAGTNVAYVKFSAANGRIYAGVGGVESVSSTTVAPDTWYLLDFRWDVSANPHVFEWQIDGVAQTQATGALAASTFSRIRFGCPNTGAAGTSIDFDDVLISTTAAEFPLGDHKIEPLFLDGPAVREFDGVDDVIEAAVGALGAEKLTGITIMALWKPLAVYPGGIIRVLDTGTNTTAYGINQYSDGNVYYSAGGFFSAPYTAADGWLIQGFTDPPLTGGDPAVSHRYSFDSDTWDHTNGPNNLGSDTVPDTVRFGHFSGNEFGPIRLAAVAVWDRPLDTSEVESLHTGLASWQELSPVAIWVFNQASRSHPVVDTTGGGADQSAVVGTRVVHGDAPPGFFGSPPVVLAGSTANFKTFSANGTLVAWDATAAKEALDEGPPVVGGGADGIAQVGAATGDYVEVPLSSYALQPGESVIGLRMLACGWAANTAAANIGFRSWNGTTESVLAATADPNFDADTSNPAWLCRQIPLETVTGQGQLDALALRVGFSDNPAVPVGVHAVLAEVAVRELSGVPATVTPAPVVASAAVPALAQNLGATALPVAVAAGAIVPAVALLASTIVTPEPVTVSALVPAPHAAEGETQNHAAPHSITVHLIPRSVRRTG